MKTLGLVQVVTTGPASVAVANPCPTASSNNEPTSRSLNALRAQRDPWDACRDFQAGRGKRYQWLSPTRARPRRVTQDPRWTSGAGLWHRGSVMALRQAWNAFCELMRLLYTNPPSS